MASLIYESYVSLQKQRKTMKNFGHGSEALG